MSTESIIEVKNVSKKFKVYYDKGNLLKEKIIFKNRNRFEERWVLNNISFSVKRGEALGLIGHNGCGKSTTLKLLTKILYPDAGEIEIKGRVSSLLELGAGFHPDMSGRENIYINASIFGLTRKEIESRIERIIKFSELREYIDNPVRTYSSGMYMRLAFAVAINVDADVLLIDEILAVGDTNFQTKCFEKLREIKSKGTTIVLVTHDHSTVESFCDEAIWLNDGEIIKKGKASNVVDAYLEFMNEKRIDVLKGEEAEKQEVENDVGREATDVDSANRFGLGYVTIDKVNIIDMDGNNTHILAEGADAIIKLYYKVHKMIDTCIFGIGIYTLDGQCIMGNNTKMDRVSVPLKGDGGEISIKLKKIPLVKGKYVLGVAVVDQDNTPLDFYRNYCYIDIISLNKGVGYITIEHEWMV